MKIIFMGATRFSEELLLHLLENHVNVHHVLTIPEEFHISYSKEKVRNYNYADISGVAKRYGIRCYEVDSVPGKRMADYEAVIAAAQPDVILALGWYYMVPKKIRDLARYGAWGIHASLLPRYAGGAPLVWAIINGEKEAGVTLFRFENGVDDGDIIEQRAFPIALEDSIHQAYQKAIAYSKQMLISALAHPERLVFRRQDKSSLEIYPQRRPDDGEIDLSRSAREIYNFIRAQTKPYPGAFSTIGGKKLTLWSAREIGDCSLVGGGEYRVGELFKNGSGGYIRLANGCLQILEVGLNGYEGDFFKLAEVECWWGRRLGS